MNRNLTVERTYSLGQYQNIKLHDEINDIPDVFEEELINEIRYLQLIQLELDFRRYIQLVDKIHPYNTEEAIGLLEEIKVQTLDEIKKLFDKGD